jgi:hypothetical protein
MSKLTQAARNILSDLAAQWKFKADVAKLIGKHSQAKQRFEQETKAAKEVADILRDAAGMEHLE